MIQSGAPVGDADISSQARMWIALATVRIENNVLNEIIPHVTSLLLEKMFGPDPPQPLQEG